MSELKATTVYDAYWKANSTGEGTGILIYLKSEADHYISELIADQQLELDDWYCKVQHHKYKRCLAMAKRCGDAYDKWMMKKANAIALSKDGIKYYHQARWKVSHYMRWQKRWQELAEKFKEAK